MRNETSVELDAVEVEWEKYAYRAGLVSPGMEKTEVFPNASFPRRAVIKWHTTDADAELHRVEVDVVSAIGRRGRWANVELVFAITEQGSVEVNIEAGLA
ncbi:MAG: hypothetical protein K8R59_02655 [Thermoanaerobaculales bacterium]|nr:hypothetical protein [Thermoanaerobaculales bacterium]